MRCQRLGLAESEVDEVAKAREALASATASCTEAKLMSILVDKSCSMKSKKSKVEATFASLAKQGKEYGQDFQVLMHPLIVKEATACVLKER